MTNLNIDTSNKDSINLSLSKSKKLIDSINTISEFKQTEILLTSIDDILTRNSCNAENLNSITINNSGSSFTSLRIGVVTVNALNYATKKKNIIIPKYSADV
ncbi:hypothetical protein ISS03_03030 [Patescibacteria group bacterium]|nr:hypothetical protein [Patescibacteria group bacterium]